MQQVYPHKMGKRHKVRIRAFNYAKLFSPPGRNLCKRYGIFINESFTLEKWKKLKMHLLVFRDNRKMIAYAGEQLKEIHSGGDSIQTMGMVICANQCFIRVEEGKEDFCFVKQDRQYVCVILLSAECIHSEGVNHEAVHAGFAYYRRVHRTRWDEPIAVFDEEGVAYPAGLVARRIYQILSKHNVRYYVHPSSV